MKFTATSILVLLGLTALHASPFPGKEGYAGIYPPSQKHMNDNIELVKQCGDQAYQELYHEPPPPPEDKELTPQVISQVHIYGGCK